MAVSPWQHGNVIVMMMEAMFFFGCTGTLQEKENSKSYDVVLLCSKINFAVCFVAVASELK
jgi:hypothetical protein